MSNLQDHIWLRQALMDNLKPLIDSLDLVLTETTTSRLVYVSGGGVNVHFPRDGKLPKPQFSNERTADVFELIRSANKLDFQESREFAFDFLLSIGVNPFGAV